MKETEIQRAICDYLSLKGYFFGRSNNTPIFDPTRKTFRALPKHTKKGFPDIWLIKAGKFFAIEVKSEKGRLSADQAEFGRECIKNGGEYIVARSLADVQAAGL